MKFLPKLFENNRAWAEQRRLEDPQYFERLSRTQTPEFLWIGCADSRVPANEIVGLGPGELFVHRNIANLAPPLDANVQSVLQYAVEALKVKHIIVCGHYGCGGVLAALRDWSGLPLENWLAYVRAVSSTLLLVYAALVTSVPPLIVVNAGAMSTIKRPIMPTTINNSSNVKALARSRCFAGVKPAPR